MRLPCPHVLPALGFALFGVLAWTAHAEIVDRIAATVDTEVILYSDVMLEVTGPIQEARRRAASEDEFQAEAARIVRDALDQAVESRILYRQALLAGVVPDEKAVDRQIDELRSMYESSQAFENELKNAGITMKEFRERIKKQRMAASLANFKLQEFEKQVVVSEAEVAEYYQRNTAQYNHPERVYVRQIFLVAPEDSPERAKARAQMEVVVDELRNGASFAELAKAHSQAPGAEQGGLVGWQRRGDLIEPLNSAVFSLEVGEVSEILESTSGIHVLQVERREQAGTRTLNEVRAEIEPLLRAERAQERLKTWMNELRKRSRVRTYL